MKNELLNSNIKKALIIVVFILLICILCTEIWYNIQLEKHIERQDELIKELLK